MQQEITCEAGTTVLEYITQHMPAWEEYKIYPLMEELHLVIDLNQTVKSLSWWEQKKLQLAKIILSNAELMLLDEPTNHLDQHSLEILQKCILDHQGIVLFVSHDRHFLNMICNKLVEIEDKNIHVYHGNYEIYKAEKQARYEKQMQAHETYQKEKKKRETRMGDMRQRASVYINPALWRLIKSKEKYIAREIYAKEVVKPKTEKNIHLYATGGTHKGKLIFEIRDQGIWFDDTILIQQINMDIRGKEKVLIAWKNGSGKTTLLKYIVALLNKTISPENTKMGNNITFDYFDQHNDIMESKDIVHTRFEKHLKIKTDENGIRSQLAMIGLSTHEIFGSMTNLSYGQKVKIRFLQMLSAPIDLLILDEPTNHLDIPTREAIETMLEEYQWALLFVSHDQYFAEKIRNNIVYHIQDKHLIKEIHLLV